MSTLGLNVSQAQLLATWLQQMQAAYPGYNPATTNPEYVQASIFASQFADIANLTSAGSTELFRQYGQKLIGLAMQNGTQAAAVATVTAIDTLGHTLPAGTQLTLTLNGTLLAFQTQATLTIPASSSTGTVTVVAGQAGAAFNGATNPCALVSQITWVSGVTVAAPASGGADQETDDAYVNRLANTMTTLAQRPITAQDYATLAINFAPAAGTDQQVVGRSVAIDGFNPTASTFTVTANGTPNLTVTATPFTGALAAPGSFASGTGFPTATFTANTANNSATLSNVSSFANIQVGALLSGTGIQTGSEVLSVNTTANTLVMSLPATANGTGITVTVTTAFVLSSTSTTIVMSANITTGTGVAALVGGTLGNQRTVGLAVSDANGNLLNSDTLAAVQAYLNNLREVNFVINTLSPSYPLIYVTVTVKGSTGYTTTTVQSNVQSAILAYLTPANFGLPQGANVGWLASTTIFQSRLASAIQLAPGVDHIVSSTLAFGLAASPSNTTDLVLPGWFPLPTTTTTSVPTGSITVT